MVSLREATDLFQEQYVDAALVACRYNKKQTARELGMSYRGFLYRLDTLTKAKATREAIKALASMKEGPNGPFAN